MSADQYDVVWRHTPDWFTVYGLQPWERVLEVIEQWRAHPRGNLLITVQR